MNWRQAPAGAAAAGVVSQNPAAPERLDSDAIEDETSWQQYLRLPPKGEETRLGICCSGGGIRSASYSLGALQALTRAGVLDEAEYLSAVSGGGYTSIAHTVLVAATLGEFEGEPTDRSKEENFFAMLRPWAENSPEERHLRDHSDYLAPGLGGKLWFLINIAFGAFRHILPFAAGIVVAGTLTGFVFHRWLRETLQAAQDKPLPDFAVPLWAVAALVGLTGIVLGARRAVQMGRAPNAATLSSLQRLTLLFLGSATGIMVLLVGLPTLLWALSRSEVDSFLSFEWLGGSLGTVIALEGLGAAVMALIASAARRGVSKFGRLLIPVLTAVLGPALVLIPFVGVTYWVTFHGLHWNSAKFNPLPLQVAIGAVLLIVYFAFRDEVTPNMHLLYRERLATGFVSQRVEVNGYLGWSEPRWELDLRLSRVRNAQVNGAKLPKLVVCAAVNLSRNVPPGRNAASFTFESDYSGGPTTGYVRTTLLEESAGLEVITLPAMMAISGAAISPSMGKLTQPGLRLLMALFNVRLGVWLPNPKRLCSRPASGLRRVLESGPEDDESTGGLRQTPLLRPGALYVLWEALGRNDLEKSHVYVTDGGHWENLGLVELLRRGCDTILCFDAAGDDIGKFHTLADAIALARADLGVLIDIDTRPLIPKENGLAEDDVVEGTILFPNGKLGRLIYAKATMPSDAPQDLLSFHEKDPKFPTHPTSDQLFNERKFESYRTLGFYAGRSAATRLEGRQGWIQRLVEQMGL
jgi:hypothetical protein